MFLSGTYEIIDGIFKDYFDGYIIPSSNLSKELMDDGGVLFSSNGGNYGFYVRTRGATQNYLYETPTCLEFDIVSFGGNPNVQFYDGRTNISRQFSQLGITGDCHLKCEFKEDATYYTIDNGTPIKYNYVCSDTARIMFTTITDTLRIKNVVIYPI